MCIDAGTLQVFNGTLTEITCSAAVPTYRLVDQERVYESFAELPDLFDIEARLSPTGNNVTLYINGTNRSNNVTVMCGNVDLSLGLSDPQFHVLSTLILEFVGRFINFIKLTTLLLMHNLVLGILPAPNDVHYIEDSPGYLQILWEPPILDSQDELDLQNASIRRDARIICYIIYITTDESTIAQVYNASGTSFAIGIDKIPCSFWFQVAAVNPAGVGERSPPQNLTFDSEFAHCMYKDISELLPTMAHTGCIGSTGSTTGMNMEPAPVSSGLAG